MDFTWLNAVNDLATAMVAVGGTVFAHKRGWSGVAIKEAVHYAPAAVKDVEAIAEGVGQAVPQVSAVEQQLKDEVAQLTNKFRQSELHRVAAIGLHAMGCTLSALSDDQLKALEFDIASKVPGVTPLEVADALAFVEKEAQNTAASPLMTAANALTQAKQSVTA